MAEAFLRSLAPTLEVMSAGTEPSDRVHPKAVEVMKELNIDLSDHFPQKVDEYLSDPFDYVITVCGHAKDNCPVFQGDVKQQLHIGFDDPAEATGTEKEIIEEFRRIRDEIQSRMKTFLDSL